ncbi:branched-chain amino acid transport system II carrier protein [Photobacterium ganghwense]|uniref:branched-chain amino acid transport system II carrier protein n=1 Tax=Photobacterium TaxID=657 RepID=UPI00235ED4C3|nr:branched-chain amino acid transport system II carrier protein [Photobacterium sp. GSS17]
MKRNDLLAIGLMTFAMFLGAGNIIFPPFLGLQAGEAFLPAMLGFLITAVGLPALTLIVLGHLSHSNQLTSALPKPLAITFWVLLFTAIGPAFGMPRAVTVAYEMGIKPFVESDSLMVFSAGFVALTLILAFRPGKLVDYIGKVMTPLLVLLLLALAASAVIAPLDTLKVASAGYEMRPVTEGLIQGYMTMDAIAAVGFGWVIIKAILNKNGGNSRHLSGITVKVTLIYAVLMSACYLAMAYVGATSASVASEASNGGEILTLYVAEVFGVYGQYLLAAIIIMACLTTTVGLTNACAEYYRETFSTPFALTATIVVVLTGVVANFGLNQILAVSLPVILVLCPVAITLVLTAMCFSGAKRQSSHYRQSVYLASVATTLVFGGLDTLSILGMLPESVQPMLERYLPLYSAHASWLPPCLLVLVVGMVASRTNTASPSAENA